MIEHVTEEIETVTLWRPTGPEELALVEASGWREWPPRLHWSAWRAATTSAVPAKPTEAGTPTPRQHHDHNELQLP
jgi:hypothetical protein